MTWAGSNNIETGVTIDLSLMNSTIYDKEAKVASILPGSRWEAVYKTLEEYNVVVPGGRTGPVGVGGFLLGGISISPSPNPPKRRIADYLTVQAETPSTLRGSDSPATTSSTTRLSLPAAGLLTPTITLTSSSSRP
jgi:hypothetical protein